MLEKRRMMREQLAFVKAARERGATITVVEPGEYSRAVRELLCLLRPMVPQGLEKVRIGGESDGGYVMADPGNGGIAYSFGVSAVSPWDLAMAERGFSVFQYDGSVDNEPDKHPNIFFHKYFVSESPTTLGPSKNLAQILKDHSHENERDIILQIDIEGGEWDFFTKISHEDMVRFKQIVIELHDIHTSPEKFAVLEKIRETHTPIHFHYNNNVLDSVYIASPGFIYNPHVVEISYVRNDECTFTEDGGYYPSLQDFPNYPGKPEIPVGSFDYLLREEW